MVRQCCRQNIPLSPFASVSGHMISLLIVPSVEKTRCDGVWKQFKKIQISFCYVSKYKWLLGESESRNCIQASIWHREPPVSKKGREQTQIGRKEKKRGGSWGEDLPFCWAGAIGWTQLPFWKMYLMETWTQKHTFIRKTELFTY